MVGVSVGGLGAGLVLYGKTLGLVPLVGICLVIGNDGGLMWVVMALLFLAFRLAFACLVLFDLHCASLRMLIVCMNVGNDFEKVRNLCQMIKC